MADAKVGYIELVEKTSHLNPSREISVHDNDWYAQIQQLVARAAKEGCDKVMIQWSPDGIEHLMNPKVTLAAVDYVDSVWFIKDMAQLGGFTRLKPTNHTQTSAIYDIPAC